MGGVVVYIYIYLQSQNSVAILAQAKMAAGFWPVFGLIRFRLFLRKSALWVYACVIIVLSHVVKPSPESLVLHSVQSVLLLPQLSATSWRGFLHLVCGPLFGLLVGFLCPPSLRDRATEEVQGYPRRVRDGTLDAGSKAVAARASVSSRVGSFSPLETCRPYAARLGAGEREHGSIARQARVGARHARLLGSPGSRHMAPHRGMLRSSRARRRGQSRTCGPSHARRLGLHSRG